MKRSKRWRQRCARDRHLPWRRPVQAHRFPRRIPQRGSNRSSRSCEEPRHETHQHARSPSRLPLQRRGTNFALASFSETRNSRFGETRLRAEHFRRTQHNARPAPPDTRNIFALQPPSRSHPSADDTARANTRPPSRLADLPHRFDEPIVRLHPLTCHRLQIPCPAHRRHVVQRRNGQGGPKFCSQPS